MELLLFCFYITNTLVDYIILSLIHYNGALIDFHYKEYYNEGEASGDLYECQGYSLSGHHNRQCFAYCSIASYKKNAE